jgi:hypothetical protein
MTLVINGLNAHKPQERSASQIASDIFQGTFVESAYDKKGKFSHLLARLPQSEFFRLYSPQTTATLFIQGYWLQLCLRSSKKRILNRETQTELTLDVAVNEFGVTQLSFFRFDRCVMRVNIRSLSAADLLSSEAGFRCVARAALKAFVKLQPHSLNVRMLSHSHLPMVLVVIHQDQKDDFDFQASRVLLQ